TTRTAAWGRSPAGAPPSLPLLPRQPAALPPPSPPLNIVVSSVPLLRNCPLFHCLTFGVHYISLAETAETPGSLLEGLGLPIAAELGLQLGDLLLQFLVLLARLGGHGLDRVELVAARDVHAVQDLGDLVADARLDLVLHAGQCAHGAVGHLGEVVDERVACLHDGLLM